jgi:hypothetical protein
VWPTTLRQPVVVSVNGDCQNTLGTPPNPPPVDGTIEPPLGMNSGKSSTTSASAMTLSVVVKKTLRELLSSEEPAGGETDTSHRRQSLTSSGTKPLRS